MKIFIVIFIIILSLVCVSSGSVKPVGYVGGYINSDGDTVGGHPSEEIMNRDRAAAGMLPGGINCGQVAVMNHQPAPKYQPPQYGRNSSGAGYTPVTVQNYLNRTVYTQIQVLEGNI
jgi:hypothetical protein